MRDLKKLEWASIQLDQRACRWLAFITLALAVICCFVPACWPIFVAAALEWCMMAAAVLLNTITWHRRWYMNPEDRDQ